MSKSLLNAGLAAAVLLCHCPIAFGQEVAMQPGTSLMLGVSVITQDPVPRAEKIAAENGMRELSVGAEQSGSPSYWGSALPDSPSTVQAQENSQSTPKSKRETPPTARSGRVFDAREAGWSFWVANAAMFGSAVAAAEMTHKCLEAGACRFVPDTFQRRRNMYLVGMPVAAGVSYFSYYLKRTRHRWWFVPVALVTAGNAVVIAHAARNH